MKILRYVMLPVLLLGISSAAHAFSWNLQDPTNPLPGVPIFDIQPGVPISFNFTKGCTFDSVVYTGCVQLFNDSHKTITSLDFSFNNTLGSVSITCSGDSFVAVECGLIPGGAQYSLDFIASCKPANHDDINGPDNDSDDCGLPPSNYAYIFENSGDPNFPTVDVVANVPEPGSIWLALSGVGSLGYLVRRRRRITSR